MDVIAGEEAAGDLWPDWLDALELTEAGGLAASEATIPWLRPDFDPSDTKAAPAPAAPAPAAARPFGEDEDLATIEELKACGFFGSEEDGGDDDCDGQNAAQQSELLAQRDCDRKTTSGGDEEGRKDARDEGDSEPPKTAAPPSADREVREVRKVRETATFRERTVPGPTTAKHEPKEDPRASSSTLTDVSRPWTGAPDPPAARAPGHPSAPLPRHGPHPHVHAGSRLDLYNVYPMPPHHPLATYAGIAHARGRGAASRGAAPPRSADHGPPVADPTHIDAHLKLQERRLLAQFHEVQLARHALHYQAHVHAMHMREAHAMARERQEQFLRAAAAASRAPHLVHHHHHLPSTPLAASQRHFALHRANSDMGALPRPAGPAATAAAVAAGPNAAQHPHMHMQRASSDDRLCAKRRLSEYPQYMQQQGCISPKSVSMKRFAAPGLGGRPAPSPSSSPTPDLTPRISAIGAAPKHPGSTRASPELHATRVTKANRRRVCEFCLRKCETEDDLHQHREKHILGESSFTCVQAGCNKTYSTGEGLRLHVRNVHLDAKVWKCLADDCDRSFVRQSDLRMHIIRIHSNIRPFPCVLTTCRKSFACHSELRRHVNSCHKLACPKPEECKPVVNSLDLAFVKRLMLKLE